MSRYRAGSPRGSRDTFSLRVPTKPTACAHPNRPRSSSLTFFKKVLESVEVPRSDRSDCLTRLARAPAPRPIFHVALSRPPRATRRLIKLSPAPPPTPAPRPTQRHTANPDYSRPRAGTTSGYKRERAGTLPSLPAPGPRPWRKADPRLKPPQILPRFSLCFPSFRHRRFRSTFTIPSQRFHRAPRSDPRAGNHAPSQFRYSHILPR